MSETEERHHHRRHGHGHRDRQPTRADYEEGDAGDEWDPHADNEVHSLRANSVKFTLTDGGDPDAVVQLHMGRDLGIYARTRSTRRRLDAVAPGKAGALAAYVKGGAVGPVDWVRAEVDSESGAPKTIHVDGNVAVEDVLIKERGSVGSAIDALREAVILGDRQRVALEREIKQLGEALTASESRVDQLDRLVRGMQHIRVEHESEATAAMWSFRTFARPDGTNVFGVVSSDGVSRAAFCARPRMAPAVRDDDDGVDGDGVDDNTHHLTPDDAIRDGDDDATGHRTPVVEAVAAPVSVQPADPAAEAQILADPPAPITDDARDRRGAAPDEGTAVAAAGSAEAPMAADRDAPPAAATPETEPVAPSESVSPAIPVPTQQRRTKGARKTRGATAEAPGSPPPTATRGVKTRQSARRASAYSTAAHADPPAVVTMARPADDAESA
ncbi:hypothetical protein [Pandoravirus japonicus]|uniref:Uncharacterized protein n=1 Tax=Pandoravirus japonicus TaxID=2823154 RepID=A0A811BR86_9VIRU|nr:hypothetical protein [Pandoravirus japonicus]